MSTRAIDFSGLVYWLAALSDDDCLTLAAKDGPKPAREA